MDFVVTPYVVFYTLTAVLSLSVTGVAWRRRTQPGAKSVAAIVAAVAWWSLAGAVELGAVEPAEKFFWSKVCYAGALIAPVALLLFAFELRQMRGWLRPFPILALFVVPFAAWVAALTDAHHHLVWTGYAPGPSGSNLIVYRHGPWFWWGAVGYSYACITVASLLLIEVAWRISQLHRWRMSMVLLAIALPWLGNAVYVSGLMPQPFDLAPIALSLSSAVFYWVLVASRLGDLVPLAGRRLLEMVPDPVMVLDAGDRLVELNPAARQWLGVDRVTLATVRVQDLLPQAPAWRELFAKPAVGVREIAAPDGVRGSYEAELVDLTGPEGRREGRLLIVRDITARKQAEAERLELERRALRAEKHQSLGWFAGGMAHDFNNLMTIVLGRLSLLEVQLDADPQARQELREAVQAGRKVADLTRQVLLYAGAAHAEFVAVDLTNLVREVVNRFRRELPASVTLELAAPVGLPPVAGEAAQLETACLHLLANAREAIGSQPGVVTVSVIHQPRGADADPGLQWVQDAPGAQAYVAVEIADTGCGIDNATRSRMFEPFFSTKALGRGLGLAVVWGVARSHQGWIGVASAPGCGTRLRLALPVSAAADQSR